MAKKKPTLAITWTNERRKLSDLIPWEHNPRTIKNAQAERLVDSVETFGQVETLAIGPENALYNGHQRLGVLAGQYGMDYEVDVRVASRELTERERQQLTVYLHKGAAGEWEPSALFENFDLTDLTTWGFDQSELDAMFTDFQTEPETGSGGNAADTAAEIDRAEELGAKWKTAEGQVWRIGDHVVICGDCREPDTWQRLLQAANVDKVNGVFTSPPYAMQRKDQYGGVPTAEYVDWWEAVQANVKANLADDGSFFVNIKAHCEDGQRVLYCMDLVCAMVRRWGWRFEDEFAWVHGGTPMDVERRFKNGFEPIYHFSTDYDFKFSPGDVKHESESVPGKYAEKKRGRIDTALSQGVTGDIFANPTSGPGLAFPSNALKFGKNSEAWGQSAAFSVALPDFFIRAYSDPGDVWLDPFCGSGTTIVAAHNNKRRGLGSEKLPKYLGVILERLQAHVGVEPELISN